MFSYIELIAQTRTDRWDEPHSAVHGLIQDFVPGRRFQACGDDVKHRELETSFRRGGDDVFCISRYLCFGKVYID